MSAQVSTSDSSAFFDSLHKKQIYFWSCLESSPPLRHPLMYNQQSRLIMNETRGFECHLECDLHHEVKSLRHSKEGQDKRGQYTIGMHCMKSPTLYPKHRLCNIIREIFNPDARLPSTMAFKFKTTFFLCDFANTFVFFLFKKKTHTPVSRLSQRSRFDSLLSRWFLRSWKTSVKKCGSAFSCSILALILLMIRSDVSQKTSLFESFMNGLSG